MESTRDGLIPRGRRLFIWLASALLCAATVTAFLLAGHGPRPTPSAPAGAERPRKVSPDAWCFALVADNRRISERPEGTYEAVLAEIRDRTVNPEPKWPAVQFVVGAGDISLSADKAANWKLWEDTFAKADHKPGYYPVLGNWDAGDDKFNREVVLPAQKGVIGKDPSNYAADFRNVRLIVSDDPNRIGQWVRSAGPGVRHVFVADHYPVFPRVGYVGMSGDGVERWRAMLRHRDRIRALLCGHTHNYSRMRVADPNGPAATDPTSYPDEPGGIYQIDAGNAGRASHSDSKLTIVLFLIDGDDVWCRTVQSTHARPAKFRLADEWRLIPAPAGTASCPATKPATSAR